MKQKQSSFRFSLSEKQPSFSDITKSAEAPKWLHQAGRGLAESTVGEMVGLPVGFLTGVALLKLRNPRLAKSLALDEGVIGKAMTIANPLNRRKEILEKAKTLALSTGAGGLAGSGLGWAHGAYAAGKNYDNRNSLLTKLKEKLNVKKANIDLPGALLGSGIGGVSGLLAGGGLGLGVAALIAKKNPGLASRLLKKIKGEEGMKDSLVNRLIQMGGATSDDTIRKAVGQEAMETGAGVGRLAGIPAGVFTGAAIGSKDDKPKSLIDKLLNR